MKIPATNSVLAAAAVAVTAWLHLPPGAPTPCETVKAEVRSIGSQRAAGMLDAADAASVMLAVSIVERAVDGMTQAQCLMRYTEYRQTGKRRALVIIDDSAHGEWMRDASIWQ